MIQSLSTVIIEIGNDEKTLKRVREALLAVGDSRVQNNSIRAALEKDDKVEPDDKAYEHRFVHFMSIVVVPDKGDGRAHLVIEVNADGRSEDILRKLAKVLHAELNRVLEAADLGKRSEHELCRFLLEHNADFSPGSCSKAGLLFHGTPDLSVQRIKCEEWFADEIRSNLLRRLDAGTGVLKGSARNILREVRDEVFANPALKWAFVSEPIARVVGEAKPVAWTSLAWAAFRDGFWPLFVVPVVAFAYRWLVSHDLVDSALCALVWFIGASALLGLIIWIGWSALRHSEREDVPLDIEPNKEDIAAIRRYEDLCVQNHLSAVSVMKRGWYRGLALRFALWLIGERGAKGSAPGFVDKIGSIHFARWIRIPETRKLVFLSNYDGSWQSYLEDFIARLREGLSSVWSNTLDFPKTELLTKGGAGDGARFKRWARRQQQPSCCWYSGYPRLTAHRIRANARIRHGFASAATEQEAAEWLSLFGYATRESLEYREIPTLVFGGLRRLPYAHCLVLQLPDKAELARKWLGRIEERITYGDGAPYESALVAAFTAEGLAKLGVDEEALATFPMAFQEGMASRARALGDADGIAWRPRATDALLMIYGKDKASLEKALKSARAGIDEHEVKVRHEIHLAKLDDEVIEPFGFRDGISQPVMRGTVRGSRETDPLNVVEPGELVLGYRDNLQTTAPVPWVRGQEFGRNGSFLVVRKLEQKTDAFDKYLRETAATLSEEQDPRVPYGSPALLREWIGAKMVGRWRNGTSLVRHPHTPGTARTRAGKVVPDNAFLYGREDPDGLRCPFGAHTRRANPRESFEPGSQKQVDISNRHRIFRVGRVYVEPPKAAKPRGLLFMCVQADIERQFEFLQQSWLNGRNFHGLVDEADPIVGCGAARTMTIPTSSGPLRLKALGEFVTFLGGAYFFMPGKSAIRTLVQGAGPRPVAYAPGRPA